MKPDAIRLNVNSYQSVIGSRHRAHFGWCTTATFAAMTGKHQRLKEPSSG